MRTKAKRQSLLPFCQTLIVLLYNNNIISSFEKNSIWFHKWVGIVEWYDPYSPYMYVCMSKNATQLKARPSAKANKLDEMWREVCCDWVYPGEWLHVEIFEDPYAISPISINAKVSQIKAFFLVTLKVGQNSDSLDHSFGWKAFFIRIMEIMSIFEFDEEKKSWKKDKYRFLINGLVNTEIGWNVWLVTREVPMFFFCLNELKRLGIETNLQRSSIKQFHFNDGLIKNRFDMNLIKFREIIFGI